MSRLPFKTGRAKRSGAVRPSTTETGTQISHGHETLWVLYVRCGIGGKAHDRRFRFWMNKLGLPVDEPVQRDVTPVDDDGVAMVPCHAWEIYGKPEQVADLLEVASKSDWAVFAHAAMSASVGGFGYGLAPAPKDRVDDGLNKIPAKPIPACKPGQSTRGWIPGVQTGTYHVPNAKRQPVTVGRWDGLKAHVRPVGHEFPVNGPVDNPISEGGDSFIKPQK